MTTLTPQDVHAAAVAAYQATQAAWAAGTATAGDVTAAWAHVQAARADLPTPTKGRRRG